MVLSIAFFIEVFMQIKVNENLTSIFNFINDCETEMTYKNLVQFCIDYKCYKELYIHQSIINKLVEEHNYDIKGGLWVKPN